MGIPVSLVLIAVGLVLALAVHSTNAGIDVNTVGWIVFAVGCLGLLLTLLFWESWAGAGGLRRTTYSEAPPRSYRPAPRRRVIEEDETRPGPPPW